MEVGGGDKQVDDKKDKEERDSGWATENPTWDPRVTGTMGYSEDESGGEKKPRGECGGGLGKQNGEKSDESREKPGGGLPKKDGHRGE